jgi:hypothetical protein
MVRACRTVVVGARQRARARHGDPRARLTAVRQLRAYDESGEDDETGERPHSAMFPTGRGQAD